MPLAHVHSFGCQQNVSDGEKIKGMLAEMGYGFTPDTAFADLILFNTCAVRENAEDRVFGNIGALKKLKEKNRNLIIAVGGCMVQQEHIAARMRKSFPQVDIIFGTHVMHTLPQMIYEKLAENRRTLSIPESDGVLVEGLPVIRESKVKASVPIMYGCNNFCTYCIVPYTRGREKSRRPENILDEVRSLVADGVKEVTLLGQNVNSYKGVSSEGDVYDFADLIYMLDEVDGLERIRFMTSHPKDLSDKLIQAYVDCRKLCNYIHLPVQSGSSSVLKRMNRKYTREQYLELAAKLRRAVPDITMSTDIIVGFPGETEEDFQETLSLVREVKYDSAFTFLYSVRKGTPAAEYEDQIPEDVKHERFNRLVDAVNEESMRKNAAYKGRVEKVLVEGVSKKNDETLTGRTEGFKLVDFEGDKELIGSMVDVEITEGKTFSLTGRIIKNR